MDAYPACHADAVGLVLGPTPHSFASKSEYGIQPVEKAPRDDQDTTLLSPPGSESGGETDFRHGLKATRGCASRSRNEGRCVRVWVQSAMRGGP